MFKLIEISPVMREGKINTSIIFFHRYIVEIQHGRVLGSVEQGNILDGGRVGGYDGSGIFDLGGRVGGQQIIEGVSLKIIVQNRGAQLVGNKIPDCHQGRIVGKLAPEDGDDLLILSQPHFLRHILRRCDDAQIQKFRPGRLSHPLNLLVKRLIGTDGIGDVPESGDESPLAGLADQPSLLNQLGDGLTDGGTADLIVADQLVFRRDSVPNLVAVVFYIAENNIL